MNNNNGSNSFINIVFDFNDSYYYPTMTMLFSLRKNVDKNISLHCYLIRYIGSINTFGEKDVKSFLYANDRVETIYVPRLFSRYNFGRWNDLVALRILAVYYLPDTVDYFLRFDGDIVVNGNVIQFYKIAIEKNQIITGTKETLQWIKDKPIYSFLNDGNYINAGSLVINIKKWKEKIEDITQFMEKVNKVPFEITAWDQDLINYFFKDDRYIMKDDRYMRFCDSYHTINGNYKSKKPVIYHFAGAHKPWVTVGNPRYRHIWWKYAKKVYPCKDKIEMHYKRTVYLLTYPFRLIKRSIAKLYKFSSKHY